MNNTFPVPALSSQDTIAQLLSSLPQEVRVGFPETLAYLESVSLAQQQRMVAQDAWVRYHQAIASAVVHTDLSSPGAVLALDLFFNNWVRSRRSVALPESFLVEMENAAVNMMDGLAIEDPVQAALPVHCNGLPVLVELFKEKALSSLREFQENPSSDPNTFIPLDGSLQTYRTLFTWKAGRVANMFCSGRANHAANLLSSLVVDVNCYYARNMGVSDYASLAQEIQEQATRVQLAREMSRASPEKALEALAMLRAAHRPSSKLPAAPFVPTTPRSGPGPRA